MFDDDGASPVTPLHRTGMALGVANDTRWTQATVKILPGSVLLLYTDGITDAHNRNNEAFGEQRLAIQAQLQLKDSAGDILANLLNSVKFHSSDAPQFDDITIMVVKRGE